MGNRLSREVTANGQVLTTEYQYYEGTDKLEKETHTGPIALVPFGNERYYAYADGSYRTADGKKIGKAGAFMLGLPTNWSQRLLNAVLMLLPVMFLLPIISHRGHKAHRVKSLLRQGLIIVLAYLMLIDPVCLQQIAYASSQYHQIETSDWGSGNRTSEYAYDANGSCVSKITKETSAGSVVETITYDYNLRNKLIRTSRAFTDWEGDIVETTEYTYNDDGDRIAIGRYRTVNAGPPEVQGGKAFIIDPYNHTGYAQPLEESSGGYITTYTIGDDVYTQAGEDDWFGQINKHLIYDGHGSTRQLTDGNGDVIYDQVYNYDGYGVMLGYAGDIEEPLTNLRYAGEYYDNDLKQYNLRSRWYDPLNGRFNQLDPYMGNNYDPQSLHKYLYCHADPINNIDPSGMSYTYAETLTVWQAIAITIAQIAPYLIGAAKILGVVTGIALVVDYVLPPILDAINEGIEGAELLYAAVMSNTQIVNKAINDVAKKLKKTVKELQKFKMFPIFKSITPDIFYFTVAALATHPWWFMLTYNGAGNPQTGINRSVVLATYAWMRATAPPDYQLDEFPYACTAQGGAGLTGGGPALASMVPGWQNALQGGFLGAFTRWTLKGQPQPFIVIPIPL